MNAMRLSIHATMLADRVRNETLRAAVERAVQPGDVVIDVGAGTGFLSLIAARAGAARVYAIEAGSLVHVARRIVAMNGYGDTIQLIASDSRRWTPPEKAAVVISETLGFAALDENFRDLAADAVERFLAPGGTFLPGRVDIHVAPVEHPPATADFEGLVDVCGFDFTPMYRLAKQAFQRTYVPPEYYLAEPQLIWSIDVNRLDRAPLRAEAAFPVTRAGTFSGLALWFEADLGGGIILSSHADDHGNHWGQTYLAATVAEHVSAGDVVRARLRLDDSAQFELGWATAAEHAVTTGIA